MGATPKMNRSAKGGARSSLHYGGEGVLIHPPYQGVCGRHGTEEQRVTSGGLIESLGGSRVSGPISASEVASDALSVVGRLNSTYEAWRKPRDRATGDGSGSGKAAGEDGREEKGSQGVKAGRRNSSLSEKPVHSRLRRLVDWINLTGAKKVHSLIDKVYKRKNLEIAWEKVKENRGSGGVDGQTLEAFETQLMTSTSPRIANTFGTNSSNTLAHIPTGFLSGSRARPSPSSRVFSNERWHRHWN